MPYKIIALAALTVAFLYATLLSIMRWRSVKNPIPANVQDVYDPETYKKWRAYQAEKSRLSIVSGAVGFITEFCAIALGAYPAFAALFPQTPFMQLFGVILLSSLLGLTALPCEYYDTMGIEEKYGFNRSSQKTFWLDQLKGLVIGLLLITGITSLLMALHQALGDYLVPVFAAALTGFMLCIAFLYPFFSRIFNKFTPLEEGELKDKLIGLLEKHGYKVRSIQVMDASRRSTKSNAYFTGFGKMKTIVLYDTLVSAMTPEEICAVFAHEMGHGLHKDTLKNQFFTLLQMTVLSVLAWLTLRLPGLFTDFGFSSINYGFAVVLIMSVEYALLAPLMGLISNAVERRAEYRADAQAVEEGYADALISALKKLTRENFSDLSPHPLLVKLEYSHPTLSQRIDAIEKRKKA